VTAVVVYGSEYRLVVVVAVVVVMVCGGGWRWWWKWWQCDGVMVRWIECSCAVVGSVNLQLIPL
jgi:hypothetical protein